MTCPVCGTPTVPGARFCYHCGSALDVALEPDAAFERRVVTVLFGDLSDFTAWAEELDPERVGAVADRALAAMTRAIADVEGHVDKLTGDGVMAIFGAPIAHEDDPTRAVRAAVAMQAAVRELMEAESGGGRRLGLRVGLNTGEVIAGVQAHLAYTVVGDTVNTAARLADAAGIGAIYAGRETAVATLPVASWRPLSPLRLKGKREPVEAFELVALRRLGADSLGDGVVAPFVGREAEYGVLVGRVLDVIDRSRPAAMVVSGEAGIGKTRLVLEATRFAGEMPELRVLWGRARPYGEGRELAPFADWVRTACGVSADDPPEDAAEKVRRTVARLSDAAPPGVAAGGLIDRLLPLVGLELDRPQPRDALAPGVPPPTSVDRSRDAVAKLLAGLAAIGPLVLVVDDLQWAEPGLLDSIAWIGGQLAGPVLLICVGRSDMLDAPHGDWWQSLPQPELLPLLPLERSAADRLLRGYLGGADLEESARRLLLDRAEGNPFFLAELLHLLVDRNLLRRTVTGWELADGLPPDLVPAGVQAVLAARIDVLDPTTKAVLRDAAVIGPVFPAAALFGIEQRAESAVRHSLAELVDRGILIVAGDGEETTSGAPGPRYAFAHTLARDAAYAGVPKAERARRHAAIAAWAAGGLGGPGGEVDGFVAGHAQQAVELAAEMALPADDPAWAARTVGFAAVHRLARAALTQEDNLRAEALFTRALALVGPTGAAEAADRLVALVGRAAARAALRRDDLADADLAEPLAGTDQLARASALVVLGQVRRQRGDEDGAIHALVSAVALASELGVDRVTGEALRQLGLVDYLAGRLASAQGRFAAALELAERIGDTRGAGWALQHLAWCATTRGDYAGAESALEQAATVFGGLDDSAGMSWCVGTEAFVRLLQGRLREARQLTQGLLPMAQAMGERWGVAACLTIDAFAGAELGDVSSALEESATAMVGFDEVADVWGQSMSLIARASALRATGELDAAVGLLERAISASEAGHLPVTRALALSRLGYCELDRGHPEQARAAAERAIATLRHLDVEPPALVGGQVLLGQALRASGEREPALRLLATAAEVTEEPSLLFPRRQALAHYAGALLETGDTTKALQIAQRALSVPAEDVRSRVIALRVLANCLTAVGDEPAANFALRQALATARSTEQTAEIPATESALAAAQTRT